MTEVTVRQCVTRFVDGQSDIGASWNAKRKRYRLRVENDNLVNYNTIIAVRLNSYILINCDDYSPTTRKHQNRLCEYVSHHPDKIGLIVTEPIVNYVAEGDSLNVKNIHRLIQKGEVI